MLFLKPSIINEGSNLFLIFTQQQRVIEEGGNTVWDTPVQITQDLVFRIDAADFWRIVDNTIQQMEQRFEDIPGVKVLPLTPEEIAVVNALHFSTTF